MTIISNYEIEVKSSFKSHYPLRTKRVIVLAYTNSIGDIKQHIQEKEALARFPPPTSLPQNGSSPRPLFHFTNYLPPSGHCLLARESGPIRLLEIPSSPNLYMLIIIVIIAILVKLLLIT